MKVGQKVCIRLEKSNYYESSQMLSHRENRDVGTIVDIGDYIRVKFTSDSDTWFYSYKDIEEVNDMTKDNLKTGMLVQTRKGDWYVMQLNTRVYSNYKDVGISLKDCCYLDFNEHTSDLLDANNEKEYDIVKIAECRYIGDVFHAIKDNKPIDQSYGFKILWERQEINPKEKQLKELVEKLQKQLKDAEGELKVIKGL